MQLEKKLHSLQPHACFRLFLTMEINPKVGGQQGETPGAASRQRAWGGLTGAASPPGACEPAARRPHLRVRAAPGGEGQHAEDVQQHPRGAHMQGKDAPRPRGPRTPGTAGHAGGLTYAQVKPPSCERGGGYANGVRWQWRGRLQASTRARSKALATSPTGVPDQVSGSPPLPSTAPSKGRGSWWEEGSGYCTGPSNSAGARGADLHALKNRVELRTTPKLYSRPPVSAGSGSRTAPPPADTRVLDARVRSGKWRSRVHAVGPHVHACEPERRGLAGVD